MKEKITKLEDFRSRACEILSTPHTYNILPTLQSLWDWLLLIDP